MERHAQTPPIESAAKENASAEETQIGAASRELLSPGNLREPGLLREALRALGNAYYRSGKRKFQTRCFLSDFEKCLSRRGILKK